MLVLLEMMKTEKQYVLSKIKSTEVNIEAITLLFWDGNLEYEKGRLKELQDTTIFLDSAINRIKLKMLKMAVDE